MWRKVSSTVRRIGPILLVDDYDDARASTREALEDAGYEVTEAANGQQALNLLVTPRESRFSLILLDLQMPVMDGWRLLELLRCYVALASIPVIVLTSHEPRLEQIRHPNLYGCLRGPYELADVVIAVDACADEIRERQQLDPAAQAAKRA